MTRASATWPNGKATTFSRKPNITMLISSHRSPRARPRVVGDVAVVAATVVIVAVIVVVVVVVGAATLTPRASFYAAARPSTRPS